MIEPTVRPATAADIPRIERLVTEAFGKYVDRIGRPPAPMTADYAQLLVDSRVWVIDVGLAAAGVLVTQAKANHLLIDSIAVSPTAQGGGLGERLLRRAELDAREQHLPEIRLCTNEAMTENLAYYPRQGFVETGRGVQEGYRRVFFVKRLEPDATSRT